MMMIADPTDPDQIMPIFKPASMRCNSFEVHVVASDWHGSNCEQTAILDLDINTWLQVYYSFSKSLKIFT